MKKELFLKGKAIFQIIILLVAVVYFSYAIKPVEAASDVCCEKTLNGQTCFYGDSGNCDPSKQYAATKCEQTSFCKLGCCYVLSEGQCYKSVPQSTCTSVDGAEWSTDATCDKVDECRLGCCVIGSQCKFTTEQSCALQTAKYPDLKMNYQSDKTTEPECLDVCRAAEKGCCVNSDKTCNYGTREACDISQGEFTNGQYCSDVALCGCAKENSKTCNDDDVYWLDSCGNLEAVAEDCDYAEGTLCKKMQGEYKCGTVNCETTYSDEKNVHDSEMGSLRKNGESWCVYESGTGDYKDRVGSRQYRHMCVNGEEVVESCRDYREEICTQAEVNSYTQSQCLHNDIYESPVTQQISTVPRGFRFWEDQGACSEADQDCTVVWVKKSRYADWKCEQNCQCETQDWVDDMAKACKSLGDCGANLNIAGERTTDGLVLSGRGKKGPPSGEPSEEAWADWSQYGVFGGMVDLLENLLKAIQDLGIEAPKGLFGMGGGMGEALVAGVVVAAAAFIVSSITTATGATVGVAVSSSIASALGTSSTSFIGLGVGAFTVIAIVVIIIVVIIMMLIFGGSKMKEYHVILECKPWQAPVGGKNCEQCLDQKKVDTLEFYDTCTEYKCKSLGQNCQFIPENAGTERVACYNSNPNDVNSPMIEPWPEALTEGFQLSTISEGYEITPEAPYYEKIEFGIKTNELSQCKMSKEHKGSYEEMTSYFGDSFYQMEHNITINPQVGGQTFEYYVRCRDGNGNSNAAEYVIRFTTTKEPDKTAPRIEGTSIKDYGYIPVSVKEVGFAAYINEPADCKWSFTDQKYDTMDNLFYCGDTEDGPTNALGYDTYACYAILNLTAQGINTYYFRCQDRSEFNNQNQQSYTFHLTSTNELKITSQSPEGTLLDTVSPTLSVTTEGGAEDGKAKCYYTDDKTRDISLWPEFYDTGKTIHIQYFLNLPQGEHEYLVNCKDVAANEANATITFKIDKDVKPPKLEYIYIDTVALHLVLDESSTCEYNNATFNYGEGVKMQGAGTNHNTASVESQYYYINCEDAYKNNWKDPIIVYL